MGGNQIVEMLVVGPLLFPYLGFGVIAISGRHCQNTPLVLARTCLKHQLVYKDIAGTSYDPQHFLN